MVKTQAELFPPSPGGDTKRHAHQNEDQAGSGIGETLVELDEEPLVVRAMCAPDELTDGQCKNRGIEAAEVSFILLVCGEGQIIYRERGDVEFLRTVFERLVLGSIAEAHEHCLRGVANDGGGGGSGDCGRAGVGDVGDEDLMSVGGTGS